MRAWLSFLLFFLMPSFVMAQSDEVVFSASGGFYDHSFYLTLGCHDSNHYIRYTTNGNAPTEKSTRYVTPLFLDERLYSSADIYKIQISPDELVYVPDSVCHTIVIRAAIFDEGNHCVSEIVTNTYLIRDLGCDATGLAVMSICADSLALFDYETGIFVPGKHWNPEVPLNSGNYYQQGRDWERSVNVEFYEPIDNSGINQVCGLRTHGNRSRRYPAKGMKIYARNDYGKNRFNHAFFEETQINSYKHLVLKPFATFWPYSGAQDYVCTALAHQLELESPQCRPIIVYLNGEYWGLYFLQEKMDERFLEDHFGIDPDNCNIIGSWKGEVENGDGYNFKRMMRWLENADLSETSDYERINEMIDLDNFIDYMVFETFVGNWDWPGNNMRCWQEGDGPWRWMFFDGDATIISNTMDVFLNAAVYAEPATWDNYPEAKLLFGKLLENNQFKAAFESRALELCGSLFQYDNTSLVFNDIVTTLRPKIEDQRHRFGYPPNTDVWNEGNARIDDFLYHRVEWYLDAMEAFPLLQPGVTFSDIDSFVVFPNPTHGAINIQMQNQYPRPVMIIVYNVVGQVVTYVFREVEEGETISLDYDLPAGVYFVRIGSCMKKMIKF